MTAEEAVQAIGHIIPYSLSEEHGALILGVVSAFAAQQVREAEQRVWEEAIKLGCRRCRDGFPVKFLLRPGADGREKQWVHPLDKGRDHAICQSDEFRRRSRAQEGKG